MSKPRVQGKLCLLSDSSNKEMVIRNAEEDAKGDVW